jgi:hypothetical protein
LLAAIAALIVITAIGAALVIFASPRAQAPNAAAVPVSSVWVPRGDGVVITLADGRVAKTGGAALMLPLPPPPSSGALWRMPQSGVQIHRVGSILLIAGIAGLIPSMMFLYWSSRSRRDRATAPA